ncbi:MAG TPA: ATP-binding protein [Cellulomonadaceae bacterium]|nr:ATP-binding protein [Cellulomonadaceae bacterium]
MAHRFTAGSGVVSAIASFVDADLSCDARRLGFAQQRRSPVRTYSRSFDARGGGIFRRARVCGARSGAVLNCSHDEAPEFSPRVLETLRQPLEHGELVIQRAGGTARYPARFQLVLAANPCPCGNAIGKGLDCTCTALARRRYFSRLSGPLLDRVDLQVDVLPVPRSALGRAARGESSAQVAGRVLQARAAQTARLTGTSWRTNAEVPGPWLRRTLGPKDSLMQDLDRALDRGLLSLRGVDRVLRVAWTLADLAGRTAPGRAEIGQAMLLRTRGQVGG